MEGKNCFRTLWRQTPLYSGGNFSTILVPRRSGTKLNRTSSPSLCHSSSCADQSSEECLVLPCGNSVYVVSNCTGEVWGSFSLPIEDVILCVDAVTVLPNSTSLDTFGEDTSPLTFPSKRLKLESSSTSKSEDSVSRDTDKTEAQEARAPPGAYIAVGTRNRQIYVIRVEDSTESVSEEVETIQTGSEKNTIETSTTVTNEGSTGIVLESSAEPEECKRVAGSSGVTVEYICTIVKQWTAAQQAISCLSFSSKGHWLVSGSTDGGVKIWNIFHHHLTHNLHCPGGSLINTVYLTDDDRFLITGGFEGHVSVFDLRKKHLIATSRPHVQAVEGLSLRLPDALVHSIGRDRKMCIQQLSFMPKSVSPSSFTTPGSTTSHYSVAKGLSEKCSIVVKEHLSCATFEGQNLLHTGSQQGVVTTYLVGPDGSLKKYKILRNPLSSSSEVDHTDQVSIRCILPQGMVKGIHRGGLWSHDTQAGPSPLLVADSDCCIRLLTSCSSSAKTQAVEDDHGLEHYTILHRLVGFCDQVLEIHSLPSSLAPLNRLVVSNSRDVQLFDGCGCLSSRCLQGHRDIVISGVVSQDGRVIATAGKDLEIRFWSTTSWETVAIGEGGHTSDITSLRFNSKQLGKDSILLLFSISADENFRLWDAGHWVLPLLGGNASTDESSKHSKIAATPSRFSPRDGVNSAHVGPIYTLEVAPNDQYVATGGKDKVVNLWALRGKKVYKEGVLKGHRRAITSLAFSKVERVLASASNDGTIRLWSLVSLNCIKTLQADRVAVLQVALFNKGTQAVTTNAEGVMRVWALGAGEVVWSGEVHEDKVWALSVQEEEDTKTESECVEAASPSLAPTTTTSSSSVEAFSGGNTTIAPVSTFPTSKKTLFLTGGADGVIVATEDCTAEEAQRVVEERKDIILKEQELINTIRKGEFKDGFLLALHLDHPRHLRQVVERWIAKDSQDCQNVLKKEIFPSLTELLTVRLLQFVREWLTNSRYCTVGSIILRAFMSSQHFLDVAKLPSMRQFVEPLLAYSRKHSHRFHDLLYKSYYIDYVTRNLAPHALTTQPLHATIAPLTTEREKSEG